MAQTAQDAPRRNAGSRRKGGRAGGARFVQWGALVLLVSSFVLWGSFVVKGAGEIAAAVLGEDPGDAPVDVLAAPRVLHPGGSVARDALERELRSLGYRAVDHTAREPGDYRFTGDLFEVYRRAHPGPAGDVPEAFVRVRIEDGRILSLQRADGTDLQAFALEPVRLGAFRGPGLEERRPLPLAKFPPRLIQAVMAAEDSRFLTHRGVDPRGIARALWNDVRGAGPMQGGSTITQQVIKNRVVGHERTIMRKAHEAVLAAYVEGRVSKERLLEIYLNEIYLGQRGSVSVMGMPAGALHYFGKNVADLGLQQCAMLAGMIASPGRFDPRRSPESARARMQWVLSRMRELGYVDAAEAQAAGSAPFGLAPLEVPLDPGGDVLDAVRRDAIARGWEPQPSRRRALVHTTLDVELQAAARRALDEALTELEAKEPSRAPLEGAVVIENPRSGEILALVGGRRGVRGGFHRALDARRQPGSAFKPLVAAGAFESGKFAPSSVLDDEPLAVATARGTWTPENYDHQFRGAVTLRQALEQSLNVPVARVGLEIGPAAIVDAAHRAGIGGTLPAQPSIALGAGEVTPLDLATAYATLAALGTRHAPVLLRSVRTAAGEDPVHLAKTGDPVAAFTPETCWLVLDCLSGVIERGTGKELLAVTGGVRVAGKTGTTQEGRDAWFGLLTGQAVVVVYVGRDDDKPAKLTGAGAALPVVKRLLAEAGPRLLAPLPERPAGLIAVEIDPETGGVATKRCPSRVTEVFPVDHQPDPCKKHMSALKRFWNRLRGK